MKKYDLVIESEITGLIKMVNIAIEHGYIPIGGILQYDGLFIQAIYLNN